MPIATLHVYVWINRYKIDNENLIRDVPFDDSTFIVAGSPVGNRNAPGRVRLVKRHGAQAVELFSQSG